MQWRLSCSCCRPHSDGKPFYCNFYLNVCEIRVVKYCNFYLNVWIRWLILDLRLYQFDIYLFLAPKIGEKINVLLPAKTWSSSSSNWIPRTPETIVFTSNPRYDSFRRTSGMWLNRDTTVVVTFTVVQLRYGLRFTPQNCCFTFSTSPFFEIQNMPLLKLNQTFLASTFSNMNLETNDLFIKGSKSPERKGMALHCIVLCLELTWGFIS